MIWYYTILCYNQQLDTIHIPKYMLPNIFDPFVSSKSDGKGLGIQFLKHIERTKILVFMIDLNSEDIIKEYNLLNKELKLFDKELLKKPSIILLTKLDAIDCDKEIKISGKKVLKISSLSKINLQKALKLITSYL